MKLNKTLTGSARALALSLSGLSPGIPDANVRQDSPMAVERGKKQIWYR